ncbi:MAG TPA: DHA2 family efflux MFS transporter permease subunit [Microbacteriaceae bacterium]|nr:DHA2 family efflux MFS transporter permease subunit [Microbacteriaceae bacterium]
MNHAEIRPWAALWSLVLGFFMILIDTTIVSVANPTIMRELDTTMTMTLWATSAYLLAYAVPLLITGRLGDRFGPKRMYLFGLVVFTLASFACGISPSIEILVVSRALQGLGASLMTPQTMAVITRIFPPKERGSAMAVWGITAGVAMLVGPILGGFLLDGLGWEWIFFINIPVGIIGFILAKKYVPELKTHVKRLDMLGIALSAIGMFLVIFGIQEGESFDWGVVWGPINIWMIIISGVIILVAFVIWQAVQKGDPLMPLAIFKDRNFSVGSAAIVTVGVTTTAMSLPYMFFLQLVHKLTPSQSALMMLPMAILSIILARPVGKLVDKRDSRFLATAGLGLYALSILFYIPLMNPDIAILWLLVPSFSLGVANAMIWGPLASVTMFSLDTNLAGAGSGIYNTSRQVGAVLGSASMAMIMQSRLTKAFGDNIPIADETGSIPQAKAELYGNAMAESLIMPMIVLLLGAIITLFFAPRPKTDQSQEAVSQR